MQHRATWHTYRAVGAAWDMRLGKRGAALDQPVNIRSMNPFVSQASNSVETLVVREDHEDIWFAHSLVSTRCCGLHGFS